MSSQMTSRQRGTENSPTRSTGWPPPASPSRRRTALAHSVSASSADMPARIAPTDNCRIPELDGGSMVWMFLRTSGTSRPSRTGSVAKSCELRRTSRQSAYRVTMCAERRESQKTGDSSRSRAYPGYGSCSHSGESGSNLTDDSSPKFRAWRRRSSEAHRPSLGHSSRQATETRIISGRTPLENTPFHASSKARPHLSSIRRTRPRSRLGTSSARVLGMSTPFYPA